MTTATQGGGIVPEWTIADRLRKAREVSELEQEQFAAEIGVSRGTISNYEKGKVSPRLIVLRAWALRCGVDLAWLVTGTVPPEGGPLAQLAELRTFNPKIVALELAA